MAALPSILLLAHLIGLALGLGCATAKLTLLLKSKADPAFLPAYVAVTRPVTRLIVVGMGLLTLSGVGWLLLGYRLTSLLVVKLTLVAAIWVLGPVIDKVVEPKFRGLAPGPGESASPAFIRVQRRYLSLEGIATGLFYVIVVMWILG
jgi:hypothetical protein